jgi:hypothetical protein
MSLCSTCSIVPFSSLPPAPLPTSSTLIAGETNLPELWFKDSETVTEHSDLGFPWHEKLDALAASAKLCPLCELVQKGAQAWIDRYEENSKNNKSFVEFNKNNSSIPSSQRLWMTKRYGGGPGFIVLVRGEKDSQRVVLLAGVGFAVDEGMYQMIVAD